MVTFSKCKSERVNTVMVTSCKDGGYSMVQGQDSEPSKSLIVRTECNIKKRTQICGSSILMT